MSEIRKGLGARIRTIRKNLGLNQRSFGDILGVGVSAVSAYESGASIPSPESLVEIAKRGDVSIDFLVTGDQKCSRAAVTERNKIPSGHFGFAQGSAQLEEEENFEWPTAMMSKHGKKVDESQPKSDELSTLVSHQDVRFELNKEEFTLLSLFRQLSAENQKEKLIELAYLASLKEKGWF